MIGRSKDFDLVTCWASKCIKEQLFRAQWLAQVSDPSSCRLSVSLSQLTDLSYDHLRHCNKCSKNCRKMIMSLNFVLSQVSAWCQILYFKIDIKVSNSHNRRYLDVPPIVGSKTCLVYRHIKGNIIGKYIDWHSDPQIY